jgi:hypothetical protein
MPGIIPRIFRFLSIAIPFFGLLFGLMVIGTLVNDRLHGAFGFILAIVTGLSLGIAALSVYYNSVDWLNLQILRRHDGPLHDGKVVAFSGFVRIDTLPLVSPFKNMNCAAYTYTVTVPASLNQGGKRLWLAEGYHMIKTRIEGSTRSLQLGSFPDLHEYNNNLEGKKWVDKTRELIAKLSSKTPSSSEWEGRSRMLEIKRADNISEIHEDCYKYIYKDSSKVFIQECALPVDHEVCIIGTYNEALNSLTAERPRLGSNLMVYRGSAEEALRQLSHDVFFLSKAAIFSLGVSGLIVGFAMLPTELSSKIPLLGSLVIQP